jgi:hypothetical protein
MNFKLALIGAVTLTLLVAGNPARGQPLPNNFWPNSTFGSGTNLAAPDGSGTPTGWVRNGSDPTIDQVTPVSLPDSSYAIMVNDQDTGNYGEWDSYVSLAGVANAGDTINVQYDQMYSVQDGEMRVAVVFYDSGNSAISAGQFVVTGDSPGWAGTIASSTFTKINQSLLVPIGAVTLNVGVVSGGSEVTSGYLVVDDLYVARAPTPDLLPGNFWPNPSFESGSNLDQTNGIPTGWNSYNSGSSIITQVTTNNYVSASHALAAVDGDSGAYGSWYSNHAPLTNTAVAGSILDLQWFELYSITNGDMRVVFTFFDGGGNGLGDNSFVVNGNSAGWQGTVAGSGFTQVNQQLTVPAGAVTIAVQLISAGSGAETGIMLIDDLSVAVHVVQPLPPTVLAGNFFPNPTFEVGVQLDNPTLGIPAGGWNRGGSSSLIDQITTINSTSPTHSLELLDGDTGNYGEWYMFFNLSGLVTDNDAVDIQWFQLYSITNGSMRLSFAFLDGGGNTLFGVDYNTSPNGTNSGWQGSVGPPSTFEQQFQRLAVPVGTTQLRVNFASGGASSVIGVMLIDDLSMRLSLPLITGVALQSGGVNLTWNSMQSKNYTVLFTSTLSGTPTWTPLATNIPGGFPTTSYLDLAVHGGNQGFYRILQQ